MASPSRFVDKRIFPHLATLLFGILLGILIWFLSHPLTGRREPWDADQPYFLVSLTIAGAVVGMLTGRRFWLAIVGLYAGQLAFMVLGPKQHGMERVPLAASMVLLALFTLVSLAVAAACVGVRWFINRRLTSQAR
jgi:hypothetical protein